MEAIVSVILSYLVGLAVNLRTDEILTTRGNELKAQLQKDDDLSKAIATTRPLSDELRAACVQLAKHRHRLGVSKQEEPLWMLLSDDAFQSDLIEWFQAGGITEGDAVKMRMQQTMETALTEGGANQERIDFLKSGYFDALDKAVFSHPVLAHWRHQLSLDYLREQVVVLRKHAEEAAGIYSPEKQKNAIDQYCETALTAWDIIDLSNLPEGDIHIATQQLLLRQLYMPLRIEVEPTKQGEGDDAALTRLEEQREVRRHREAGHLFADTSDRSNRTESRAPIGERLGASLRLVILGDPGGGKTTMLRWMATAYLLRYKDDTAFRQVPDAETLPAQSWIPVLIRCRDLGVQDLCSCFTDFLTQHLNKTELQPDEADIMRAVILDRLASGKTLLLVDGLDEITDPQVRMMFCQELERVSTRYPDAPIVVTSRIVGYRDMPYRMNSRFEHGVIAELNKDDKDLFAKRWVEVTEQQQTATEKAKRVEELLEALHSSDRIERLTGNPMLLTTLALVKRKVGKLPNRRSELYAEAVYVLLNFNPKYRIIDKAEAIPQLAYLAYEMCRLGTQSLTEDEVLELLEKFRHEYKNVRSASRHTPQDFLTHLEAQSSILIKSGGSWQKDKNHEVPVWEFRHLTFQEYLAASALLEGRFPDRNKSESLAQQVAPLAGAVEKVKRRRPGQEEMDVSESWREALRLLVADCKDDDVDEVLLAILNPALDEDATKTARPRAVLAALCLADEPNISEESARQVLETFVSATSEKDGIERVRSSLDSAAVEVCSSMWWPIFKELLIQKYCERPSDISVSIGGLLGMLEMVCWKKSGIDSPTFFNDLAVHLNSDDRVEIITAALMAMEAAFEGVIENVDNIADNLLDLLATEDLPVIHAAAWALGWLNKGAIGSDEPYWVVGTSDVDRVAQAMEATNASEVSTIYWLAQILGSSKDSRVLPALLLHLDNSSTKIRKTIINALVKLGDKQAVPPLLKKLDVTDKDTRIAVIKALGRLGDKQVVEPLISLLGSSDDEVCVVAAASLSALGSVRGVSALTLFLKHASKKRRMLAVKERVSLRDKPNEKELLSQDFDGYGPWIDPVTPITEERIADAAKKLEISTQEVRALYEAIATDFNLSFEKSA